MGVLPPRLLTLMFLYPDIQYLYSSSCMADFKFKLWITKTTILPHNINNKARISFFLYCPFFLYFPFFLLLRNWKVKLFWHNSIYITPTIIWQTSIGNIEGSKQNCTEWYLNFEVFSKLPFYAPIVTNAPKSKYYYTTRYLQTFTKQKLQQQQTLRL